MTFLLDFNHPFIYFCADAFKVMEDNGLTAYDEDVPVFHHVRIHTGPSEYFLAHCESSPGWCKSTNILGLVALRRLGFRLTDEGFSLDAAPPWF